MPRPRHAPAADQARSRPNAAKDLHHLCLSSPRHPFARPFASCRARRSVEDFDTSASSKVRPSPGTCRGRATARAAPWARHCSHTQVCLLHFVKLKRHPGLSQLPVPLPSVAAKRLNGAYEFALTRDGLWLPMPRAGSWMLVRGGPNASVETFSSGQIAAYLDQLSGGAIARRVESVRARQRGRGRASDGRLWGQGERLQLRGGGQVWVRGSRPSRG